jgi:hypothetical protein
MRAQKRLFDSLVEDEYQQKGTEVLLTTALRFATLDEAREVCFPRTPKFRSYCRPLVADFSPLKPNKTL